MTSYVWTVVLDFMLINYLFHYQINRKLQNFWRKYTVLCCQAYMQKFNWESQKHFCEVLTPVWTPNIYFKSQILNFSNSPFQKLKRSNFLVENHQTNKHKVSNVYCLVNEWLDFCEPHIIVKDVSKKNNLTLEFSEF
jgi:hypothetical protein